MGCSCLLKKYISANLCGVIRMKIQVQEKAQLKKALFCHINGYFNTNYIKYMKYLDFYLSSTAMFCLSIFTIYVEITLCFII